MIETKKIKCPHCGEIQSENIYDFVDTGDTEGTFNEECEFCERSFTVNFEFVPFIETLS